MRPGPCLRGSQGQDLPGAENQKRRTSEQCSRSKDMLPNSSLHNSGKIAADGRGRKICIGEGAWAIGIRGGLPIFRDGQIEGACGVDGALKVPPKHN
jgi:hypothetical protein